MAECLKEITLQTLWQYEISEQEEEEYINDQVVPLNLMVRESYLNYLKRVITKNLNVCSDSSIIYAQHDIEKCACLLELKALRLCMVTSLYQKAILQIVADIKQHTKESKLYGKFEEFLSQNCLCKISKCKATQTNLLEPKIEGGRNIHEEKVNCVLIKTELCDKNVAHHVDTPGQTTSVSTDVNYHKSWLTKDFSPLPTFSLHHDDNQLKEIENGEMLINDKESHSDKTDECNDLNSNYDKSAKILLNSGSFSSSTKTKPNDTLHKAHSNIKYDNQKTNTTCNSNFNTSGDDEKEAIKQLTSFLTDDCSKSEFGEALLYETATQELIRILESEGEFSENDEKDVKPTEEMLPQVFCDKMENSLWQTEKHLQKKRLFECISNKCYKPEAKVKMKNKFFDLFGFDSDEDDVWCSKKKIAQYKKKIAPSVVKHLLPYYKQKRIRSRHLFKCVASHITDKLVSVKHFPEEVDVEKGITLFFSYHGFIGKSEDVWTGWDRELY